MIRTLAADTILPFPDVPGLPISRRAGAGKSLLPAGARMDWDGEHDYMEVIYPDGTTRIAVCDQLPLIFSLPIFRWTYRPRIKPGKTRFIKGRELIACEDR